MTDEGNNIWSYDIAEAGARNGFTLDDNSNYVIRFSADWDSERESYELFIGNDCLGDIAYLTGESVENYYLPARTSYIAEWVNSDPAVYATPVRITSTGNVIGEVLFKGDTFYSTYCAFVGSGNIDWASMYYDYNLKETAEAVAKKLGLTEAERDRALKEAGFTEQDGNLVRSYVRLQLPCPGR